MFFRSRFKQVIYQGFLFYRTTCWITNSLALDVSTEAGLSFVTESLQLPLDQPSSFCWSCLLPSTVSHQNLLSILSAMGIMGTALHEQISSRYFEGEWYLDIFTGVSGSLRRPSFLDIYSATSLSLVITFATIAV